MTENPTRDESLQTARAFAEVALDRKAEAVVALDVRELTSFTDAFVIATGTSDRHVRAVADAILERGRDLGHKRLGAEGYDEGRWVLIDFNAVVVHVFQEDVRDDYDLERLWGDAAAIDFDDVA